MRQQVGADRFKVAPAPIVVAATKVQRCQPARVGGAGGERRHDASDVVWVNEVEQAGVIERVRRVAEDTFEGRAVPEDQAVCPDDRHDVGAVLDQRSEAVLTLAERNLDLLPRGDIAGDQHQVGVGAHPQDSQADFEVDSMTVLMLDRRFEVADGLTSGGTAPNAVGDVLALLWNDDLQHGWQRQQLVERVARDLAERAVHVQGALAVDDHQPFADLALGFEQRLEQLGPATEDVFEPLAGNQSDGLVDVVLRQAHAAAPTSWVSPWCRAGWTGTSPAARQSPYNDASGGSPAPTRAYHT